VFCSLLNVRSTFNVSTLIRGRSTFYNVSTLIRGRSTFYSYYVAAEATES
jgi:hypothetical protein